MNKSYLLFKLSLILILFSCGEKDEKKEPPEKIVFNTDKVIGIGRIEPEGKIVKLSSEVNGIVEKISNNAGVHINEGEIIISLTNSIQQASLNQAYSRINTQKESVIASNSAFQSIAIKAENAKREYERNKNMFEGGAVTKKTFDDIKTNYESILKDLDQAKANLNASNKRILELQADAKVAQKQFDQRFIKAPANGLVLNLDITPGAEVNPNTSFGDFAPDGKTMAICEIDELFAQKIKNGQRAYIRNQGSTDTLSWGQVTYTAPFLRKKSLFSDQVGDAEDRRVREVHITLQPNEPLLFGSRIECVIHLTKPN